MGLDLEIRRQAAHILVGILIVLLVFFDVITYWHVLGLLGILLVLFLVRLKTKIRIVEYVSEFFERKNEKHLFEGPITFLAGCFAALFIFEKNIALASVLIMTLGDGMSTIVGKKWGVKRIPWSSKTIAGTFGGFIFAVVGAVLFVSIWHALIAGAVAMIVESFDADFLSLNDNIAMPVVAGAVLSVLALL